VRSYDVIVIGAGIIGLSLAVELSKERLKVLVVEKGEPGREASWAAGGMLADFPLETPEALHELAAASAAMYPEFVDALQDESGLKIDLRSQGTLLLSDQLLDARTADNHILPARLAELEPRLKPARAMAGTNPAIYLNERSVDPRQLSSAAIAALRHRGIDLSSGNEVLAVDVKDDKAFGIRTGKTQFRANCVVNCAGAWATQVEPIHFPTRPVKGQMLCVIMPEKELIRHVIRTSDVYLIPRTDGRMLIGSTVEDVGFDKRTIPDTIEKLNRAAIDLVPALAEARFLEAWAGLRPGTPDRLPILGATAIDGYFVATGHFRDGILLAPITAKIMAQIITGQTPSTDVSKFSAARFATSAGAESKLAAS
jgi:glycine oxidase